MQAIAGFIRAELPFALHMCAAWPVKPRQATVWPFSSDGTGSRMAACAGAPAMLLLNLRRCACWTQDDTALHKRMHLCFSLSTEGTAL